MLTALEELWLLLQMPGRAGEPHTGQLVQGPEWVCSPQDTAEQPMGTPRSRFSSPLRPRVPPAWRHRSVWSLANRICSNTRGIYWAADAACRRGGARTVSPHRQDGDVLPWTVASRGCIGWHWVDEKWRGWAHLDEGVHGILVLKHAASKGPRLVVPKRLLLPQGLRSHHRVVHPALPCGRHAMVQGRHLGWRHALTKKGHHPACAPTGPGTGRQEHRFGVGQSDHTMRLPHE